MSSVFVNSVAIAFWLIGLFSYLVLPIHENSNIKECKICIDDGHQYPCNCEYIQKYNELIFFPMIFFSSSIIIFIFNLIFNT